MIVTVNEPAGNANPDAAKSKEKEVQNYEKNEKMDIDEFVEIDRRY